MIFGETISLGVIFGGDQPEKDRFNLFAQKCVSVCVDFNLLLTAGKSTHDPVIDHKISILHKRRNKMLR